MAHPLKQRNLRYSTQTYKNLRQNEKHQFAASHALQLYKANAIYTFIPKNACSTMRLSLAMANGYVSQVEDFNWIHQNNETFRPDLKDLILAAYTFVILRCPYARLASVYLNKIVERTSEAWIFYNLVERKIELDTLTFTDFIRQLKNPEILTGNIHWRSQVDFLVYQEYDDYFCLEEFTKAQEVLQNKIGLEVIDARSLTLHGTDRFEFIENEDFSVTSPGDIYNLKMSGKCPHPKSLYNDETRALVSQLFKQDIDFYRQKFGVNNLMYS